MTKLFLFSLSIIFLGASHFSYGMEERQNVPPPVPSRLTKPTITKLSPSITKPSPRFNLRKNIEKENIKEITLSYPQRFSSNPLELILNAAYNYDKQSTKAVTIIIDGVKYKISLKTTYDKLLNLKRAVQASYINEQNHFLLGNKNFENLSTTTVIVDPRISAVFKEIQTYSGETATSEGTVGCLGLYKLELKGSNSLIKYPIREANPIEASLRLSITPTKK